MHCFRLLFTFLILSMMAPLSLARSISGIQLIQQLYRTYAWETENARAVSPSFIDASRKQLINFLEPTLAEALLQDKACRIQTQQVCRLDFSPLWDSQDPAAKDLQVRRGKSTSTIRVSFSVPGAARRVSLTYELLDTPKGLRIRDIGYSNRLSLRGILGLK